MSTPEIFVETIDSKSKATPIVLLHGWGHSRHSMKALGELLASDRKVYLVDLPGFGDSADVINEQTKNWGTLEYAQALKTHFNSIGLTHFFLLGTSFGGRVSLRLAKMAPELLSGLILLNSHGLKRSYTFNQKTRNWYIKNLRNLCKFIDSIAKTKIFESWFVPRYASADYKSSQKLKGVLVNTVNEDQSEEVKSISTKTMLVWGEKDTEAPFEFCKKFSQLIPSVDKEGIVTIPEAGHLFYMGGGAYLAATVILPWLKKQEVSA